MPFIFPFFLIKNICDIRIFNAGSDSGSHKQLIASDSNQIKILPFYLGRVDLNQATSVGELAKYLKVVYTNTYVPYSEDSEIKTEIKQGIYNSNKYKKFNFDQDEFAIKEDLPGFPLQKGNTCVTYSFFAWWYCRNGRLSCLRNEIFSEKNSVYNRLIKKLLQFAVVRSSTSSNATTSSYGQFLEEYQLGVKQSKETTLKMFYGDYPRLNTETFVVRNFILKKVTQKLTVPAQKCTTQTQIVALSGCGGCGKTKLALQFFLGLQNVQENKNQEIIPYYENSSNYTIKFWVDASDNQILEKELLAIAGDFAKDGGIEIKPESNKNEILTSLIKWLELEKNSGWLLVVDNANDQLDYSLLPKRGGHILITSQFTNWTNRVPVPNMNSPQEIPSAVQLLRNIVGRTDPRVSDLFLNDIKLLLEDVGYLPLAISLLGIYMITCNSIATCRTDYAKNKELILSSKELPAEDKHNSLFTTWQMAAERLPQKSLILLLSIVNLDTDCLRYQTLKKFYNYYPFIMPVLNYSLAEYNPDLDKISIQPTLIDIINKLHGNEILMSKDVTLTYLIPRISNIYDQVENNLRTKAAWEFLPHLLAIDRKTDPEYIPLVVSQQFSFKIRKKYLLSLIFQLCKKLGNIPMAIDYMNKRISLLNLLPPSYSNKERYLLSGLISLGECYRELKLYNLGEKSFRLALERATQLNYDFKIGQALVSLAKFYRDLRILNEAEKFLKQAKDLLNLNRMRKEQAQAISLMIEKENSALFELSINDAPNTVYTHCKNPYIDISGLPAMMVAEEQCKANPQSPTAHEDLAAAYYLVNKIRQATTHYNKALELDQSSIELKILLARSYQLLNHYNEAETLLRNLLAQDLTQYSQKTLFAERLIHNLLARTLAQNPQKIIQSELAGLLFRQRRFHDSMPYLQQIISQCDNDIQTYYLYVETDMLETKLHKEFHSYDLFIKIPIKWLAYYMLIISQVAELKIEIASETFENFKANVLANPSSLGYRMLSYSLTTLGRIEEAREISQLDTSDHHITDNTFQEFTFEETQANNLDALIQQIAPVPQAQSFRYESQDSTYNPMSLR